ncbi:NAD-dependent epimerase/dehydratase family protein [Leifsonia sp. YAF41]|uniref:NAD-dependent epimerase/dehydratase family protein n=1 Tax=Leifsonia sp. YAF41 TaxID=3233086 RepID=UPI003F97C6E0
MKIVVAGASGVLGRQFLPLLTSSGHETIGLVRTERGATRVRELGGEAAFADLLNRDAVVQALERSRPDAVVHLATAIPPKLDPRKMARQFEATNLLRTTGARNLLDAADKVGVRRVISQSLAYGYDPDAAGLAVEDDAFWARPPAQFRPIMNSLQELEARTRESNGVILRFGHLYGPGTMYALGGSFAADVRAGKLPIVGGGTATFSFIHAHDAAMALLAALESDVTGPFNIVDDEPAPMSTWLPYFAEQLGAPEPKRFPTAIARLAVGGWGVAYTTRLRGADNTRAEQVLGWKPSISSWRAGFAKPHTG